MTGIYINGVSGKMGTNLLKLCANDKNIKICDDLNDDSLEVVIDFSHPDSTLKLLKSLPTTKNITNYRNNWLKRRTFSIYRRNL